MMGRLKMLDLSNVDHRPRKWRTKSQRLEIAGPSHFQTVSRLLFCSLQQNPHTRESSFVPKSSVFTVYASFALIPQNALDRCAVAASLPQLAHTGIETRMSTWDKSYSSVWCDEADLTHITLWSSCCSSCSDGGSGIGRRRRVDVIVVVAVVTRWTGMPRCERPDCGWSLWETAVLSRRPAVVQVAACLDAGVVLQIAFLRAADFYDLDSYRTPALTWPTKLDSTSPLHYLYSLLSLKRDVVCYLWGPPFAWSCILRCMLWIWTNHDMDMDVLCACVHLDCYLILFYLSYSLFYENLSDNGRSICFVGRYGVFSTWVWCATAVNISNHEFYFLCFFCSYSRDKKLSRLLFGERGVSTVQGYCPTRQLSNQLTTY